MPFISMEVGGLGGLFCTFCAFLVLFFPIETFTFTGGSWLIVVGFRGVVLSRWMEVVGDGWSYHHPSNKATKYQSTRPSRSSCDLLTNVKPAIRCQPTPNRYWCVRHVQTWKTTEVSEKHFVYHLVIICVNGKSSINQRFKLESHRYSKCWISNCCVWVLQGAHIWVFLWGSCFLWLGNELNWIKLWNGSYVWLPESTQNDQ